MPNFHPALMDDIDCALLLELQLNARESFAELGRRVHLSTPAVIERVKRLEDDGVILGYRAAVDPKRLGLPMRAFIKVTVPGDHLAQYAELVGTLPEILECHRVTGVESYLVHVVVRDMGHLEAIIDSMMPYVSTTTSMVLASPVQWNPIVPPGCQKAKKKERPANSAKPRAPGRGAGNEKTSSRR
jgi:Lrp/AsnC family transcriptional regulator, leucine-responsive regulatory protein